MTTSLFIATHPRSTSTALERAFLTRTGDGSHADTVCIHEPFGEPFYYGPERMSTRFSEAACADVARTYPHQLRYADVVADIDRQHDTAHSGKSVVVIKDMAQYIVTPRGTGRSDMVIDHSFFSGTAAESDVSDNSSSSSSSVGENEKKVVVLIRAPHLSVPSYYRCCMPPLSARTGFDFYDPDEAGYRELRILYDRLRDDGATPLIIDSADLCRRPRQTIQRVCEHAGIDFRESMLEWEQNSEHEQQLFKKWNGFHDDALNSRGFNAAGEKPSATTSKTAVLAETADTRNNNNNDDDDFKVDYDKWAAEWSKKFSPEQVAEIKASVERNLEDYLYLRQFCERL